MIIAVGLRLRPSLGRRWRKPWGSLKHDHLELTEKFKESEKRRKSAEAGLKSAETQAEDQRKELYSTQINLATEK